MSDSSLEARIQALEDIEAIKRLKARYANMVDTLQPEEVLKCFAPEASCDFGPMGYLPTRAHIDQYYRAAPSEIPFCIHFISNPHIELDGPDKATGTWYFDLQSIPASSGKAIETAGRYYDTYVKISGQWLLSHTSLDVFYATEPAKGWAEQRWAFPSATFIGGKESAKLWRGGTTGSPTA